MKVVPASYPGWSNHPAYRVATFEDWIEISQWMFVNNVEHFLLSSGQAGYTFQVRKNKEWFMLRWG